jgi:hypothetical protein
VVSKKTVDDKNTNSKNRLDKYLILPRIENCLKKNQSFIILGFDILLKMVDKLSIHIKTKINAELKKIKQKIDAKIEFIKKDFDNRLKRYEDKKINMEATMLTVTLNIASILFWTGANWIGPTGSNITTFTAGAFKKLKKNLFQHGSVAVLKEISSNFDKQLSTVRGIVTPPPPTGIPPIPWVGYK